MPQTENIYQVGFGGMCTTPNTFDNQPSNWLQGAETIAEATLQKPKAFAELHVGNGHNDQYIRESAFQPTPKGTLRGTPLDLGLCTIPGKLDESKCLQGKPEQN